MAEVALADAAARFPVRIGRPEEFERVRGFLRAAGFDATTRSAARSVSKISASSPASTGTLRHSRRRLHCCAP